MGARRRLGVLVTCCLVILGAVTAANSSARCERVNLFSGFNDPGPRANLRTIGCLRGTDDTRYLTPGATHGQGAVVSAKDLGPPSGTLTTGTTKHTLQFTWDNLRLDWISQVVALTAGADAVLAITFPDGTTDTVRYRHPAALTEPGPDGSCEPPSESSPPSSSSLQPPSPSPSSSSSQEDPCAQS